LQIFSAIIIYKNLIIVRRRGRSYNRRMNEEILYTELLGGIKRYQVSGADLRRSGYDMKYEREDAVKSGFSLFFIGSMSFLDFQRKLKEKRQRDNLDTLFGVKKIPSNNEIRMLLDPIDPKGFREIYRRNLQIAGWNGILKHCETIDGELLMALDGVHYYSSKEVHCKHCQHRKDSHDKEGRELYYHTAVCGAIVRPGSNIVIPLMPEFITNVDGNEKQDCERGAGKRLIEKYKEDYGSGLVLLGDDLYSNHPFCSEVERAGMSYIFTCKPQTHKWMTEVIENSYLAEKKVTRWNAHKKAHEIYHYTWINQVPIRDDSDHKKALMVNYFSLEVTLKESGKRVFYNSWITNKELNKGNIITYAEYGRARWKIENENNMVLKERGYNLEHNYGHGKEHLSEVFVTLNLLAFMCHSILDFISILWQKARKIDGRRDMLFFYLQAYLRIQIFASWSSLLQFICQEDEKPPDFCN
jgi:hypothetical protein